MSDSAVVLVEISHSAAAARGRAAAVAEWLLGRGVIAVNGSPDRLLRPSGYVAGPRYAEVAPDPHGQVGRIANSGVEVVTGRRVHHPVENYEPPRCRGCGTAIDAGVHHDLVEPWLRGSEPDVACSACGRVEPLGDWDGGWTYVVGELAVEFHNWPPLTEPFVHELGARLGPRWRVVRSHS